ncbi:MAG TPA: ion channel [Methylophilus sp.]|nr:ion channel [Methylophilus sp.]HQQ32817.1 ion channel [Methylophilus sp.]
MMHDYSNWWINSVVVIATLMAIGACVLVHFEGLISVYRKLPHISTPPRMRLIFVIGAILALHIIEIWIFGIIEWLLLSVPGTGALAGQTQLHILDIIYLSAVTFTTVGYGDLTPNGPIRFMLGTEALTGFVLITWSASFTYLEMERLWRRP